ncbi:MAG: hypothetical protein AAFR21_13385 [Pseudomonadota bacterium]
MNSIRFPLAALTFILAMTPAFAAERYRHLVFRETPFAPYAGIHQIDDETAASVAHYAFSYDNDGRVVRIAHQIGDAVIGDNGNWDGFIWFAPRVDVSYEPGREIHTYFNEAGDQIQAHGCVYRAVYQLDEDQARSSLRFFDQDGAPCESEWNIHRYDWRVSDDGHILEKRFNLALEQQPVRPYFKFHEVKLEYDRHGRLAFMRNLGLDGQPTNNDSGAGIDRITYDLDGNFIRWQVYDKEGRPIEGNRPGVHLGEHLYDQYGNKTGLRGFDRFGAEMPFVSSGVLLRLNAYDSYGNVALRRAILPDGEEGLQLAYRYSSDGRTLEEIRGQDAGGNLTAHPSLSGAAIARFAMDENGAPVRRLFNADGTPFEQAQ